MEPSPLMSHQEVLDYLKITGKALSQLVNSGVLGRDEKRKPIEIEGVKISGGRSR